MPILKKPVRKVAKKAIKKTAKKATKKTTKRASVGPRGKETITKRPYHRKAANPLLHVELQAKDTQPELETMVTDTKMNRDLGAEEFIGMALGGVEDHGQFSACGVLNCIPVNKVRAARGRMTDCVKRLMQVTLDVANCSRGSQAEVDVAIAKRNLAIAEFELSIDGLEKAIRG